MVLQDAFEAAQKFLDEEIRIKHRTEIVISKCRELDDAWSFSYDARAYLENGVFPALAGNCPIIVPKSGAAPYIASIFGRS